MRAGAVEMWWIGAAEPLPALLDTAARQAAAVFSARVTRRDPADRPPDSFDPRRGQHSSTRILHWLADRRPAEATKVVALTDTDLFIPVLTFVFGEAQLGGVAAVVSTARLLDHRGPPDARRLAERLAKEVVHELGHTFGLVHCDRPRCVMRRSASLSDVDAKAVTPCPDCRLRLDEGVGEERPHDFHARPHPHPGR